MPWTVASGYSVLMAQSTLIAVFAGESEAAAARQALIDSGVSLSDIAMSTNLTSDGIAAEAPGQAYENQVDVTGGGLARMVKSAFTTAKDSDTADAQRMADVQRGSVVLTVTSPADVAAVTAILRRSGAVAIRC